ncbi:hypothetical protein K450DRAFT_226772 [Umbelopsis ramanniana AG]|uniref:Uncharacterized protein n=1 Tax=Umbelopsis ramanniana AG TaxID=1314678 RepID=A0AAD5EF71_UMBRA|nr:uncharacterized protein K450DRAFT_226772 [Umbelopsis ramanniana AG]KAI8582756.1 hypothetical protein K450DRAFT_226772 [Umbelopsis ramanniana AG]
MTNTLDSHPFQNVFKRYKPLEVVPLHSRQQVDIPFAMPWRMNLLETSQTLPSTYFLVENDQILVYDDNPALDILISQTHTLKNPNQLLSNGRVDSPYKINAIKVGFIGDEEVLVSVAENGNVCVWRTSDLEAPPILLRNDDSTWGIAIHAKQKLIAVCANNHEVTIFNMSVHPSMKQDDTKSILGSEAECRLIGHGHNIPNIDFSDCGRFVVSCSIDRSCRVWDLKKKKVVCQRNFADLGRYSDNWGWSVKFLSRSSVKPLFCDHEQLRQAMKGRPSYGKPTLGLSYFGIQHTAGAPLFLVDSDSLDFDIGGFDLDGADDGYDDYEDMDDDGLDWENENLAIQGEDYLDGVTPQDESEASDQSDSSRGSRSDSNGDSSIVENEIANGDNDEDHDNDEILVESSPASLHRSIRSSQSSGQSSPQDHSRYGVQLAQEYLWRQEQEGNDRLPRVMSARAAAALRERQSPVRRDSRPQESPESTSEIESQRAREIARNASTNTFFARTSLDNDENTMQLLLPEPTHTPSESPFSRRLTTSAQMLEVAQGGWSDDEDDNIMGEETDNTTNEDEKEEPVTDVYQDAIPRPFTSHNVQLDRSERIVELECICNPLKRPGVECMCPAGNDFPDQLVVLTTGKNIYLMDPKQRMLKLAVDKNILSDIDLRTDRMLCMMDRLNLVEWIPELELLIVASQKGMVALVRVLRVDLGDDEEEYVFNREAYLPHSHQRSSPLYGLTVKKHETYNAKHGACAPRHEVFWHLYLMYYDGGVLSYKIARNQHTQPRRLAAIWV